MNPLAPVKLVRSNPDLPGNGDRRRRIPEEMLKCDYRPPDADFYCWRFKVWYSTYDCAFRTRYRTFEGCRCCAQGDFNLRLRSRDPLFRTHLGGSKA
jgi:hypothetical protein